MNFELNKMSELNDELNTNFESYRIDIFKGQRTAARVQIVNISFIINHLFVIYFMYVKTKMYTFYS